NLRIPIEQDGVDAYGVAASDLLEIGAGLSVVKILSKVLDLSDPEQFFYNVALVVRVDDGFKNRQNLPHYTAPEQAGRNRAPREERPVIVGFGPAGMFAALELIDYGFKPLIFERGKRIGERSVDVRRFIEERRLDPESNIQFGEGGAGSYSDGKLFSRRDSNTSYVNRVLRTFIKFGAPEEIGYIGKPHLGTDLLCKIVRNIRRYILERGGEIHYGARMTDLLISEGRALGITINHDREYLSSAIYLALGHSARDTVKMLHERGVALERRPISVGVRIEHSAETVNLMRYGGKYKDFPGLGAAAYSLNHTNRRTGRGVYTFCMCPGGEVVNASSEPGGLVLNGMSYSRRSSPFSNAGLVVNCQVGDYPTAGPLAGLAFQQDIESRAFKAGGGDWQAPAQNLMAFLGKERSATLHETSYKMGARPADLQEILPGFVVKQLMAAFYKWKDEVPLFVSNRAILFAPETRTSSPVRIKRDDRHESVNIKNLFPIGEGSGYTGGITSSAADAIRAVENQVGDEVPA
ncbi:MAG: dehydrogenase, partial [Desulfurivibrionaceae bacterium]|nr:dehydrogenase [Desulfurivibrionaceae bacterium]